MEKVVLDLKLFRVERILCTVDESYSFSHSAFSVPMVSSSVKEPRL
jgi:hypothetical protein